MDQFRDDRVRNVSLVRLQGRVGFLDGQLPKQLAGDGDALGIRQKNQLDRAQRLGHLDGDGVGIEAVGVALAIHSQRRDDRDDIVLHECVQKLHVDAIDLAGMLVIDTLKDASRVSHHGVGAAAAKVRGRQTFQDFMCDPVGGIERQIQGGRVGDAGAVEVAGGLTGFLGQTVNLVAGSMDKGDFYAQGAHRARCRAADCENSPPR